MAVVLSLVGSAVVADLGGDARLLLVRNAWISLPFAGITLWSLRHPQPLCYTITRAMMSRRAAVMDELWDSNARFRDAWKWITVCLGDRGGHRRRRPDRCLLHSADLGSTRDGPGDHGGDHRGAAGPDAGAAPPQRDLAHGLRPAPPGRRHSTSGASTLNPPAVDGVHCITYL
jgi:hypothetical protein